MASPSWSSHRSSPEDNPRSGGKILRGRTPATHAPPYEKPSPSPSSSQPRKPSWLSGILSSPATLISSIFGSEDSSSSESSWTSDYSSSSSSGEDEDIDTTTSKELCQLNQGRKKYNSMRDYVEASPSIVPKIESKLAIEQLLMQETYSRDECKKLMEILQSRVVDYQSVEVGEVGTQKETLNNSSVRAISFIKGCRSLDLHNELQGTITCSLSSGISSLQAHTPDPRASPVLEANKWFEEKKLVSGLNASLDSGPYTLNTDYAIEGKLGSPVDIAKSYMRSLPPRRSPSLFSTGFSTPQHSMSKIYKDHNYVTTSNSLHSSKVLKRRYLATELLNTFGEIRNVRVKSTDNLIELPNDGQIDPSMSLLEYKASKISSAADGRDPLAENHCINENLSLLDEKATEVNCSVETGNATAVSVISKLDEALCAGQSTNGNAMPTSSVPTQFELGSETKFSDPKVHISDEKKNNLLPCEKDMEVLPQTKKPFNNFPLPNESLFSPTILIEHDGDPFSKAKILLPEEIKSAAHSDVDVTNRDDVQFPIVKTISMLGERVQVDMLSKLTSVGEKDPVADSRDQNGDAQLQKEARVSSDKIAVNGASENKKNSDLESLSKGGRSPTSSNINGPDLCIREGTCEFSEAALDIPVNSINFPPRKIPNGTRMKSIERILNEAKAGMSRHGKSSVDESSRGRGSGRRRGRGRERGKSSYENQLSTV